MISRLHDSSPPKTAPNQPMQLTSPDTAQSVGPPLCLLSGLAADWHVMRAVTPQIVSSSRVLRYTLNGSPE